MKRFDSALGLAVMMLWCSTGARAEGLSTPFVDVELNSVMPGHALRVRDSEGHGLRIKNLGASPIRVAIEVLIPQPSQLRPGAQVIPDVQWIQSLPSILELGAHEEREAALVLNVPRNKAFRGRYYQAMIWSHGVPSPTQGMTISAGLLSKLRFHVKD